MRHLPVRLLARIKSKKLIIVSLLMLPITLISGIAAADSIAKTFSSDTAISPGYVVSLKKNDQSKVELASAKALSRIYGVVINPSDSAVTLQTGNGQVVVATGGNYEVLASLSGGVIKTGDYLSLSPNDGIAAKAGTDQDYIVGRAIADFDGGQGIISGSGSSATGRVPIQVSPGKNPLAKSDPNVPGPLLKLVNTIAAQPVSPQRVYAALGVFVVALVVASGLIYVGVRSSMISIGRNPLSKHSIMRGMLQVVIAAALVFGFGLIGVYLLIRI